MGLPLSATKSWGILTGEEEAQEAEAGRSKDDDNDEDDDDKSVTGKVDTGCALHTTC